MSQPIINERHFNLLRAALSDGPEAAASYRAWRKSVALDDIDFSALRILPLLVDTINRYRINEPDIARIKGASKQTWLDNMVRARLLIDVTEIISTSGIDTVAMKGAALLARYPYLAKMRGSGDYDILVRRKDAKRVVDILLATGFHAEGFLADLFTHPDFDLIHAMAFARSNTRHAIDVHWWPLPGWFDGDYVDGLFHRADKVRLLDRTLSVPRLDDHLFLSVKRISLDDPDEILLRSVEVALLLRGSDGCLDWDHFFFLVKKHHSAANAKNILKIVRSVVHAAIPGDIITRLHLECQQSEQSQSTLPNRPGDLPFLWRKHTARAIDFGEWSTAYLEGFSFPENQGRWTDGEFAVMAIRIDHPSEPTIQVRLEVVPYLPPGATRFAFEIYGGCDPVKLIVLTPQDPFPFSIVVPVRVQADTAAMAIITFRLIDAGSPKATGLSQDARLLGLMIRRVSACVIAR